MRAVKAKALRRLARTIKHDKPERQLFALRHGKRYPMADGRVKNVVSQQAVNGPDTVRGFYRALKRNPALYNKAAAK